MSKKNILIVATLTAAALIAGSEPAHAQKLGSLLNNASKMIDGIITPLNALCYIAGTYMGVNATLRMKAHVDNPNQTPLNEVVRRYLGGGMFLAAPTMINAAVESLFNKDATAASNTMALTGVSFSGASGSGLDAMIARVMTNIYGPAQGMLSVFGWVAGLSLILVGIHRLSKRMEDGPRGPAGMGTIMSFVAGAALMASGESAGTFSQTLFGDATSKTNVIISKEVLPDGGAEVAGTIKAILAFVMVVGYIAFIRGWFVLKNFADGQSGATLAQGLTFLFGGALAINLGDFVQILATTLGLQGISFS